MSHLMASQCPGPAGRAQTDADPENNSSGESYHGKQDRRPGHQSSQQPGDYWGKGGVDGVDEPEPAAHKVARQDEANGTGSKRY
jgi:hypothetical protein